MIEIRHLTKRFGARLAVRDVSLTVAPGEVLVVIGPNGAGKSTILKSVVGIVRPSAGRVVVGGHDLAVDPEAVRRLTGYVSQRLAFPDHVACVDLCRLVAALRGVEPKAAVGALEAVALSDRALSKVRDLSGGQRQRLSLALALVGAPRALVLDEPSISLDAEGAEIVCAALAGAKARGAAVLFASHHLHEVAAHADRVVALKEGAAVASVAASQVRDPSAFATFYRLAVSREVQDAA